MRREWTGESKDADIGLAGGRGRGVIFAKGEILETLDEHEFLPHLKAGIDRLVEEREAARAKETVAS